MSSLGPLLPEAPWTIPGYRIEALMYRRIGSWATYRATDLDREALVALTILGAQLNHDAAFERRFLRDMRLLATLGHPNLLPVLDFGRAARGLFVVSDYSPSTSLERILASRTLDLGQAARLLEPVADAVDFAHWDRVLHRGIAPPHILITPSGRVLLTGFALTDPKATARGPDLTPLAYVAPELFDSVPVTGRADVYGLAATLFRCVTGVDPFPAPAPLAAGRSDHAAALMKPAGRTPPPATSLQPGLPRALDELIARALAEDPDERPASAEELMRAVRDITGDRHPHEAR